MPNDLEEMILREGPDTVAAFIAEPVMGAGGVIVPPATYFDKIQAVLAKYDVLFIADEVICGFGRTGEMFGSTALDMQPDIDLRRQGADLGLHADLGAVLINEDDVPGDAGREPRRSAPSATASPIPATRSASAVAIKTLEIYAAREHRREGAREGSAVPEAALGARRPPAGRRSARHRPDRGHGDRRGQADEASVRSQKGRGGEGRDLRTGRRTDRPLADGRPDRASARR